MWGVDSKSVVQVLGKSLFRLYHATVPVGYPKLSIMSHDVVDRQVFLCIMLWVIFFIIITMNGP